MPFDMPFDMPLEENRYNFNADLKEKVIKDLEKFLSGVQEIVFAYIHGSFLDDLPFRDIDIAIYFDDNVSAHKQVDLCLGLSAELSSKFHLPVDVHSLNRASQGFCYYEVTKGKVIISRDDEKMFDFVEKTWQKYFDFKPVLKQNLYDLLE